MVYRAYNLAADTTTAAAPATVVVERVLKDLLEELTTSHMEASVLTHMAALELLFCILLRAETWL